MHVDSQAFNNNLLSEDCTLPSSPANGEVIGSDLHGESIEFNCDRGYGTNATVTDTCEDGVWENGGVTPACYGEKSET